MSHDSQSNSNLSQIVNKVAEAAIATQLNSASKIDVNFDSNLPHILQGKANSLQITGEKVVTVKDIHLEKIDVTCQDISLDLTQALLGKVAFEQPGDFQVKLVFTESDCDRLLNSEYVRILLQNLVLDIDSQPASFYLQQGKCNLAAQGELSLAGKLFLKRQQTKTALFEIALKLDRAKLGIEFCGGRYLEGQTLGLDETVAIMNKVRDLLYLRHFENEDLTFTVTQLGIEERQLIIQADTRIKRLPDSISQSLESVSSEINN